MKKLIATTAIALASLLVGVHTGASANDPGASLTTVSATRVLDTRQTAQVPAGTTIVVDTGS
jgi:hypothetical protein